jgi:hypothetical protein
MTTLLTLLAWGLLAAFLRLAWHLIRAGQQRRRIDASAINAVPMRLEGPAPLSTEEATRHPAHYLADIHRIAHSHDIHSN